MESFRWAIRMAAERRRGKRRKEKLGEDVVDLNFFSCVREDQCFSDCRQKLR